jgi:hypothetical protein
LDIQLLGIVLPAYLNIGSLLLRIVSGVYA